MTLEDVKTIIESVFYLATGAAAWVGISTWKREIRGNAQYTLCKNVLVHSFRYVDAIKSARSPFMSSAEWENFDPEAVAPETEHQTQIRRQFFAYRKRLAAVRDERAQLYGYKLEARALMGGAAERAIEALMKQSVELSSAIETYFLMTYEGHSEEDSKLYRRLHNIVYGIGPSKEMTDSDRFDDGGFSESLETNLEEVESRFSKFIRKA